MHVSPGQWFARLSLSRKLTGIGVIAAAVSLLLVSLVFLAYDFATSRTRLVRDMGMLADVIGRNSTATIAFGDAAAAGETLSAVALNEHIASAQILAFDGTSLARYDPTTAPASTTLVPAAALASVQARRAWHQFTGDRLLLVRPIVFHDDVIGAVYLEATLQEIRDRAVGLAEMVGLALLGAVGLSLALASRLQRVISAPLLRLTDITRTVTAERRYDVRAADTGHDEIGELMAGFNRMLEEIQQRDATLQRQQGALEAAVASRTAQLLAANTDLIGARDKAMEASRAKSEFLANMSHEIRTPMNGIIGMTELALGNDLTADTRDSLTTVKTSAETLLSILNDILDFSKIESRKLELEAVPISLADLVNDLLKPFSHRAQQKGLELILRIADDVPTGILGDPVRLQQVIANLVGNALKFTERGHILVDVREEARADNCTRLRFSVADTGIGIAPDQQARVFDAFSQADGSTTRRFGGTGLGLTISASLVRLMGGTIWLESEPGAGTTFHFTASFDIAALPAVARHDPRLAGLPALVVDDNDVNRRILVSQLSRWAMAPAQADSADAAMEALLAAADAGNPYGLVLLDVHMPGTNGFEAARRIRARSELADTAIVMLTSSGQSGDAARCRDLGISAYLTKPVRPTDLLEQIRRVLARDAAPPTETVTVPRPAVRAGVPLRILLAEDNVVNQRVAVGLLSRRGHAVTVAENGRVALELSGRESFDVVLMDVQMPEMGGFEATTRIRERELTTGGHLHIVAMTAHAMTGDRERCLAIGMDGYVSKPVDAAMLFSAVEQRAEGALPTPAAFEPADLVSRLGGDEALAADIIRLFLADCPIRLRAIKAAVDARDAEAIRTSAHALRGAAGSIGATAVADASRTLERIGEEGRLDAAVAAWRVLSADVASLLDALRRAQTDQAPRAHAVGDR